MSENKKSGDLYRVVLKEGTHLAKSKDTPGAVRGTQLSNRNNKINGQAEFVKVDESDLGYDYNAISEYQNHSDVELTEEQKEMAALIGEAIAAGTWWVLSEVVAPRVKCWWQGKAFPSIKTMYGVITGKEKSKLKAEKIMEESRVSISETSHPNGNVPGLFSQELDEAYKKYVKDMTSEEAQRELLDIFLLSAIVAAKINKLANARIRKSNTASSEYIEGKTVIEKLSTPEFVGCINMILESNPSLMEEKATSFVEILGRSLIINGQYLPIDSNAFREALAL